MKLRPKYRKVSVGIWNDSKFRAMSDHGKLAFLFLLTHPHMTPLGAIRANLPGLACELGWSVEAFAQAFAEASGEASGKCTIVHDAKAGIVWFPNFIRHNPPESPNVIKSWVGGYNDLPECHLKQHILSKAFQEVEGMHTAFAKAFAEVFGPALGKACPNQEQEQEQEEEESPNGLSSPPSGGDAPAPVSELPVEDPEATEDDGKGGRVPACPYTRIVEAYNQTLGGVLPQVKEITDKRKRTLRARWATHPDRQNLEWWRDYFARIGRSAFLTGRKGNFRASFDWVINPGNMVKINEKNFDDKSSENGGLTHDNGESSEKRWTDPNRNRWASQPADRDGGVPSAR